MSVADLACHQLAQAFNACLRLDPQSQERLTALSGRVITFDLVGLGLSCSVHIAPDGALVLSGAVDEPNVTLRGTPLALLRAVRAGGQATFARDIQIVGDTELARRLNEIVSDMDFDWEEQLSRYTGDVIAHQLGNVARSGLAWWRGAAAALGQDLADYLRYEADHVPARVEVDAFLNDVDRLRDDVERLTARVARLRATAGLESAHA